MSIIQLHPKEDPVVELGTAVESFLMGAISDEPSIVIINRFLRIFDMDRVTAMKALFMLRDKSMGLGERRSFRTIVDFLIESHPDAIKNNITLFPTYGRWSDVINCIVDDTSEEGVVRKKALWVIKQHLNQDVDSLTRGLPISTLAKWLPSINSRRSEVRATAEIIRRYMRWTTAKYRRVCAELRRKLDVVEVKMSARRPDAINYDRVPKNALKKYHVYFKIHDQDAYQRNKRRMDKISRAKPDQIPKVPEHLMSVIRSHRYVMVKGC